VEFLCRCGKRGITIIAFTKKGEFLMVIYQFLQSIFSLSELSRVYQKKRAFGDLFIYIFTFNGPLNQLSE
jgi:hypothetical protein